MAATIEAQTASERMAIAIDNLLEGILKANAGDDNIGIMGQNVMSMIKMTGFTSKIAEQPEEASLAFAAEGRAWLSWVEHGGAPPVQS